MSNSFGVVPFLSAKTGGGQTLHQLSDLNKGLFGGRLVGEALTSRPRRQCTRVITN